MAAIKTSTAATLIKGIKMLFKTEPERAWRDHIEAVATEVTKEEEGE